MVTQGRVTHAKGPTNVAARMELKRGDVDDGFRRSRRRGRARIPHADGPSGLHRAARLRGARSAKTAGQSCWCTYAGPVRGARSAWPAIVGIDPALVKVIPTEIGGGFGGKIVVYLEPLAVVLSRKAQRPVKMVMSRDEVFQATVRPPATKIRVKIGAKRDGTVIAASASLYYEAGAYRGSPAGAGTAMCLCAVQRSPTSSSKHSTSSSTNRRWRRIARPARRWRASPLSRRSTRSRAS